MAIWFVIPVVIMFVKALIVEMIAVVHALQMGIIFVHQMEHLLANILTMVLIAHRDVYQTLIKPVTRMVIYIAS